LNVYNSFRFKNELIFELVVNYCSIGASTLGQDEGCIAGKQTSTPAVLNDVVLGDLNPVTALHQAMPGQMPWLKSFCPGLRPG